MRWAGACRRACGRAVRARSRGRRDDEPGAIQTLARDNKRLSKLLHDAKLRIPNACLEDVDHRPKRELDRAHVRRLGIGTWIAERQNVIITGPTGVGKTYFGCAFGQLACRLSSP